MSDLASTSRPVLTARTPEDVLALVPVLLGFHPEDSLVMLSLGAGLPHGRIDMPRSVGDVRLVTDKLLAAARRHGASRVAVVAYTDDPVVCAAATVALATGIEERGGELVIGVRAHAGRWFSLSRADPGGASGAGERYDISAHPLVVEAVVRGEVTLASRSELAQEVGPDPVLVAEVSRCLGRWRPNRLNRRGRVEILSEVLADAAVGDGLTPEAAARLIWVVADRRVRELALMRLTRADASASVRLWTRAVRGAPPGLVAGPAVLVGFAAWLAGQGALAWCAVDRCLVDDPDDQLAPYLMGILDQAVAPREWDRVTRAWGRLPDRDW